MNAGRWDDVNNPYHHWLMVAAACRRRCVLPSFRYWFGRVDSARIVTRVVVCSDRTILEFSVYMYGRISDLGMARHGHIVQYPIDRAQSVLITSSVCFVVPRGMGAGSPRPSTVSLSPSTLSRVVCVSPRSHPPPHRHDGTKERKEKEGRPVREAWTHKRGGRCSDQEGVSDPCTEAPSRQGRRCRSV